MIKRILLVTNIFPPFIGGPATFINRLGYELTHRGYIVTVVCSSPTPVDSSDKERPFKVKRVYAPYNILQEIKVFIYLFKEMLKHEIIFVNGLERQVELVSRWSDRRYVLKIVGDSIWESARNTGLTDLDIDTFQSVALEDRFLQRVYKKRQQYLNRASFIITPSDYLQRLVVSWGISSEKIVTVLNGIPKEEFSRVQTKRQNNEKLKVTFIGRLTNWKGIDALLLAVKDIKEVETGIIGDGPEFPILKSLANHLGISEKVKFLGRCNKVEVEEELKKTHVLILPSLYEGLSHVLLEAGAKAIPCIASNRGGNCEVIEDGVDGFLIEPADVEALKNHLIKFRDDEILRQKTGLAFQEKVRKNFPFEKTVDKIINIIKSL